MQENAYYFERRIEIDGSKTERKYSTKYCSNIYT